MDTTMTLTDVSHLLKISEQTARNRLCLGLPMPPSFRIGRRRLFLQLEVELWLAKQRACQSAIVSDESTQETNM